MNIIRGSDGVTYGSIEEWEAVSDARTGEFITFPEPVGQTRTYRVTGEMTFFYDDGWNERVERMKNA